MRGLMEETLKERSLPLSEHTTMAMLRRHGVLSSAELARKVFVTPQAMGQIIASMERRGLIQRRPDPSHGRRQLAELTPAGLALVTESLEELTSVEQHFLTPLSPREREYFLTLFTACVEFLETHPTLPGPGDAEAMPPGEDGPVAP
ncbi:MAG: MarR family transcriptional regulator [Pseudonocardiaceae bacterium]|nr:MarR family transcriptional regulator [Pseudonocardiaceae bacterium]